MKKLLLAFCIASSALLHAGSFEIITLGSDGGVYDGNTSGYLLKGKNDKKYVALDAGTILPGIKKALENNNFKNFEIPKETEWTDEGYILREGIGGYFLSHAHLDHISGLVISSTEDTKKPIYGLNSALEVLKSSVFNWKLWPNFGNEGVGFKLNQYSYTALEPKKDYKIEGTDLTVQAFPLSHSNYESTMFLFNDGKDYIAYYGDVGPDSIEKSSNLDDTFKVLAPLIKEKKLKGIIIEVSFPNGKPDNLLFGHLTPQWLNKEMERLAAYAGEKNMEELKVVITHIKPSLKKNENVRALITDQLNNTNKYKLNYLFPVQGEKIEF